MMPPNYSLLDEEPTGTVACLRMALGWLERALDTLLLSLEISLPSERMSIDKYAQKLADFFMASFGDERENRGLPRNLNISEEILPSPTKFLVAGFNSSESTGRVYRVTVPYDPTQFDYLPKNEELLQKKCGIVCGRESNAFREAYQKLLPTCGSQQI